MRPVPTPRTEPNPLQLRILRELDANTGRLMFHLLGFFVEHEHHVEPGRIEHLKFSTILVMQRAGWLAREGRNEHEYDRRVITPAGRRWAADDAPDAALRVVRATPRKSGPTPTKAATLAALDGAAWNLTHAAAALNVPRQAIYRAMFVHAIARPVPAKHARKTPESAHDGFDASPRCDECCDHGTGRDGRPVCEPLPATETSTRGR